MTDYRCNLRLRWAYSGCNPGVFKQSFNLEAPHDNKICNRDDKLPEGEKIVERRKENKS